MTQHNPEFVSRVAKVLAYPRIRRGGTYHEDFAQAALDAVHEWDKEQASAAVHAEHEGNRTIEGRGWKQLSGFKTNDGWTNL